MRGGGFKNRANFARLGKTLAKKPRRARVPALAPALQPSPARLIYAPSRCTLQQTGCGLGQCSDTAVKIFWCQLLPTLLTANHTTAAGTFNALRVLVESPDNNTRYLVPPVMVSSARRAATCGTPAYNRSA